MDWLDATLWAGALLAFVVGDWVTTRRGRAAAHVHERNPVARRVVKMLGFDAGLLAVKAVALAVGAAGYLYARAVDWPFPELFPLVFLVVGLVVTGWNLRVLARR
jgi:hypothetical protein